MKSAVLLPLLASTAVGFAPIADRASATVAKSSAASVEEGEGEVESAKRVYPTVNGSVNNPLLNLFYPRNLFDNLSIIRTADPEKFCAGLPGATAPLGEFDPLGFTKGLPVQEIKRFREAEVTHGRVAMLATLGYLVAENFHPLFNGVIYGPANTHLTQVQKEAPFFFAFLAAAIAIAELGRSLYGWENPLEAARKNRAMAQEEDFEGKTWLTKLNDDYYPGDIAFDPLGLKPLDPQEFAQMQTKELNNGRLAMFAAIGMIVQELVTGSPLFA